MMHFFWIFREAVVNSTQIGYNILSNNLGCSITSVILNLQNFKRDSYISVICQASERAVEGRKADADTHLATARSQNTETGILGDIQKMKDSRLSAVFLIYTIGNGYYYEFDFHEIVVMRKLNDGILCRDKAYIEKRAWDKRI